jgi:muramoyltetrapeptide carboxypeptidase
MPSPANRSPIKPFALRPGDKVGIIAPASNVKRDALEAGCERVREAGYEPVYDPSILDRNLYFAGPAERRVRELEGMFERDDIRAVICARGGYGSNYLLPRSRIRGGVADGRATGLRLEMLAQHAKIFVGYSDLTTLLTTFLDAANFVVFHGPMIAKDFAHADGVDWNSWRSAVSGAATWEITGDSGAKPLVAGEAEGILYGGCLSILVAALGTPYDIQTAGKILFLEDIAAKPYQIDRMLMQLKLSGKLNDVRGIIFGEMLDCRQSATEDYRLEEVVLRVVGDLGVPIAFGMRSGHVSRSNIMLPIGVRARLEVASEVKLKILESAVETGT